MGIALGALAQLLLAALIGWVAGDRILDLVWSRRGAPDEASSSEHGPAGFTAWNGPPAWGLPERALLAVVGFVAFSVALMVLHLLTGGAVFGLPGVVPALALAFLIACGRRADRPHNIRWLPLLAMAAALFLLFVVPEVRGGIGVRTGDAPWHMGWSQQLLYGDPVPTGPAPEFGSNAYPWGWHAVIAAMVRLVPGSDSLVALVALHLLIVAAIPLAATCLARLVDRRAGWAAAAATGLIGGFGWISARSPAFVTTPRDARFGADLVVASPNSVYELFPPALPRELGLVLLAGAGVWLAAALGSGRMSAAIATGAVVGITGLVSVPMGAIALVWTATTLLVHGSLQAVRKRPRGSAGIPARRAAGAPAAGEEGSADPPASRRGAIPPGGSAEPLVPPSAGSAEPRAALLNGSAEPPPGATGGAPGSGLAAWTGVARAGLAMFATSAVLFALWAGPVAGRYVREGGFVSITPRLGYEWPLASSLWSWGLLLPLAVAGVVLVLLRGSPGRAFLLAFLGGTVIMMGLALARGSLDWNLAGNATLLHQGRIWPALHLLGGALGGVALWNTFHWVRARSRLLGTAALTLTLGAGAISPALASQSLAVILQKHQDGFVYGSPDLGPGSFVRRAGAVLSADDVIRVSAAGLRSTCARGTLCANDKLGFLLFQFSGCRLARYDDPKFEGNDLRIRFAEAARAWDRQMTHGPPFEADYVVRLTSRKHSAEESVLARGTFAGRTWVLVPARS